MRHEPKSASGCLEKALRAQRAGTYRRALLCAAWSHQKSAPRRSCRVMVQRRPACEICLGRQLGAEQILWQRLTWNVTSVESPGNDSLVEPSAARVRIPCRPETDAGLKLSSKNAKLELNDILLYCNSNNVNFAHRIISNDVPPSRPFAKLSPNSSVYAAPGTGSAAVPAATFILQRYLIIASTTQDGHELQVQHVPYSAQYGWYVRQRRSGSSGDESGESRAKILL